MVLLFLLIDGRSKFRRRFCCKPRRALVSGWLRGMYRGRQTGAVAALSLVGRAAADRENGGNASCHCAGGLEGKAARSLTTQIILSRVKMEAVCTE